LNFRGGLPKTACGWHNRADALSIKPLGKPPRNVAIRAKEPRTTNAILAELNCGPPLYKILAVHRWHECAVLQACLISIAAQGLMAKQGGAHSNRLTAPRFGCVPAASAEGVARTSQSDTAALAMLRICLAPQRRPPIGPHNLEIAQSFSEILCSCLCSGQEHLTAVDTRIPQKRSEIMAAVRQKNTGPEMRLRRVLHAAGYRYRIHKPDLPGTPDLAFVTRRKAIFVHGCFWHGHGCAKGKLPKSRRAYWFPKIARNRQRDRQNIAELKCRGWRSLVIWQCQMRNVDELLKTVSRFLDEGQ
jgi:DNA mismatch endonuclease (patch repair protein)